MHTEIYVKKNQNEIFQKLLQDNKKRKGVITNPSGLQYEIITLGKGPKPALTDMVKLNYVGTRLVACSITNRTFY